MSQIFNVCARTTTRVLRNVFLRNMSGAESMAPRYRPSNLDKRILVWTKKFNSIDEIPQTVRGDLIDRARSEARIKLANILMVLTALASLGAVLSGKAAAKRGESVHQQNLDWHKQYQDNYSKNEEATKTQPSQ